MVHDINNPFAEPEERFESPFFEIVFAFMTGSVVIWIVNYSSYDALFGIVTNHARIKMIVFCMKLEDAFDQKDDQLMQKGVKEFINEQNRMYRFVDVIQDSYNVWLGIILTITMIQLSFLMFHISAGYGFDLRYIFFSLICVAHIFLPCNYASNLKIMSTETATMIYCSRWETVLSKKVAKVIPFIIARAQIPIQLTFYIFEFDMKLFVNILKSSYSIFMLMRT
uniref:Odorant receptor n=1 Tax=Leucinodes orbonalis TaxID=711050 RepID=A0AAU0QKA6_9NEOP|nr:odorant receptor [Leucinodes orbonalis]